MATIVLKVRKDKQSPWITNFSLGGWRVRNQSDTGWITLTPNNTKIRNATNTGWITPQ